jgi:hypothetical protein
LFAETTLLVYRQVGACGSLGKLLQPRLEPNESAETKKTGRVRGTRPAFFFLLPEKRWDDWRERGQDFFERIASGEPQ